mmetsp:Transcript_88732/g.173546  ORF Transcript_88732/g.173546 Transcript_88732/m.173546 type:complete len:216 (-) Transcript_88732:280-927(-)
MHLVNEEDDLALRRLHLLQHRLEALLELPAVLCAAHQCAEVQRNDTATLQVLGHIAPHDPAREALDDASLADAGVPDQDGVVLRAPRQYADHAPDLLVPADDGVKLAGLGGGHKVRAVLVQRVEVRIPGGADDLLRATQLLHRLLNGLHAEAGLGQRLAACPYRCDEQVRDADMGVALLLTHRLRVRDNLPHLVVRLRLLGRRADLGELGEACID